ncbi:MAG: hypothetical protein N2561_05170 [Bacteroidetes bacterium]|nr:hypothetical protein [Rhodothermia bacterium]MCS7154929.1 hypothetical protein [Bacteroidota bacterium]MCX7906912.1 hypothetical protein [Bacteroidota bacterium]MDW8137724.1 hypothetical protein [Bacteroidota bacterium]MDW8285322.1 hypothetical protein [Bacteroidota bacterium]
MSAHPPADPRTDPTLRRRNRWLLALLSAIMLGIAGYTYWWIRTYGNLPDPRAKRQQEQPKQP